MSEDYWRACIKGLSDAVSLDVYCQGWYDDQHLFHRRTERQDGYNDAGTDVHNKVWAYMERCLNPTPAFETQVELVASGLCFWGGEKDDKLAFLCSDMFAWGCADAEDVGDEELPDVYAIWKDDPKWGLDKWVLRKRNEQPQALVKKRMIEAGAWSDDLESLPENLYDKKCRERKEKDAQ